MYSVTASDRETLYYGVAAKPLDMYKQIRGLCLVLGSVGPGALFGSRGSLGLGSLRPELFGSRGSLGPRCAVSPFCWGWGDRKSPHLGLVMCPGLVMLS